MRAVLVVWLGVFASPVLAADGEPPRVARARARTSAGIQQAFQRAGVVWPPEELLLRVFKEEAVLEVWASARGRQMVKVREYPVCASSGVLGPKRAQGDLQVPEGFYRVDRFNPWSAFHLSLGIDYPNRSDRLRSVGVDPGGDIFIHGGCATVGCVPIEDEAIEELYVIATAARTKPVQVHLFPRRMTEEGVQQLTSTMPEHAELWRELATGYEAFERTRRPPGIQVEPRTGRYRVRAAGPPLARRTRPGGRPSGVPAGGGARLAVPVQRGTGRRGGAAGACRESVLLTRTGAAPSVPLLFQEPASAPRQQSGSSSTAAPAEAEAAVRQQQRRTANVTAW